jgi:hypothetical protein
VRTRVSYIYDTLLHVHYHDWVNDIHFFVPVTFYKFLMRYNVLKTFKSENYVNRQQSPNVLSWISWILNVCVWRPVEWHLITIHSGIQFIADFVWQHSRFIHVHVCTYMLYNLQVIFILTFASWSSWENVWVIQTIASLTIQHGPMTTFTCWRSLYFKVLILLFQL